MRQWGRATWIFVLLLLALASYKLWQVSLTRQLEQELQRLQKLGEPTKIEDLLPTVTPRRDGTLFYQLAIAQLDMAKRQLSYPVWDSVYQFIASEPTRPYKLADVQRTLQASQLALQTFRKALSFPHMRMTDWSVENPMSVMFPHFPKFREFARLLAAEGKWRKQKGDIDSAVESHMTILKLVRRMGDEPSLVTGFLVQGTIYKIAYGGLQQVLSDADASPQTYRSLMAELNSWDIDRDLVRAIQSERVIVITICKWMREKVSRKMLHKLSVGEQPFRVNLAVSLKPKDALIIQNGLRTLEHQNAIIAIARKGAPYDWEA
ncbi:MAG: hypothetical protein NZ781_13045, partial [Armatimonadetes bacterium]|nr:hypothetical protein [Armatimonadota bacterium]